VDRRSSLVERARPARADGDVDSVGGESLGGSTPESLAGRENERYARRALVPASLRDSASEGG
jgi:hypothetical protein